MTDATVAKSPFLGACRREEVPRTPVWFMRQAGRALPEYREIRGSGSILEAIAQPELAAEITIQPVHRYGVDAAILYSDIVVPVAAIGFGVDIVAGVGPAVEHPFARASDLDRLRPLEPEVDTPYVAETVKILARDLTVPLIGFAGAPFTVASYLIEGGPSRNYVKTKALMYENPALWGRLLERLADIAVASLRSQVEAGASAIQLFDSWVGSLSVSDYRRYVMPATRRVFAALEDLDVPRIHFGVNTGELLGDFAQAGADVVGVDWRVSLDAARRRIDDCRRRGGDRGRDGSGGRGGSGGTALQGNLDPAACVAGIGPATVKTREVLAAAGGQPGHIFNLGHGVLPETDPGVLAAVVQLVHEETAAQ